MAQVGRKLVQVGPKMAQVADFGIQSGPWEAQVADLEVQNGPWDQVNGCEAAPRRHRGGTEDAPRMHQGATEDAPRMHQGATEDAPRNDLAVETGPRAHHQIKKGLYITMDLGISFDLTRSGHKARRIILYYFTLPKLRPPISR